MNFAENLNRLMVERAWKPVHLAAALATDGVDCTPQTIERWMNGDNEPRASMVHFLAKAFDVSTEELFRQPATAAAEA